MNKMIRIWRGKLEITKNETDYIVNDSKTGLIIHVDKLELNESVSYRHYPHEGWLRMSTKCDKYIGCIWINSNTDMKKVKKFLRETK